MSLSLSAQTNYDFRTSLQKSGDLLQIGIPATAFTMSILNKDWKGVKLFALSGITNYTVTQLIKNATDKSRPNDPFNFQAFPSGHTSSAFHGASFIQRRYGWKYGKYAYVLAAFVGYSRVDSKNHDLWDVLGGAAVGIGSTYIFTKPMQKNNIKLGFSNYRDYKIVGISLEF